ncbi:preprotein translocase subunit SecE [Candidatus Falkowbacteria bacterium CG10_big_fil_rev_8_21_14_0_10_43_11]|uniref:Protein translocase subunit SecE n=1 Tax=Candidatus Falkowbacteria bacterium CG10_big_fil_rev_8_21_14_0_10_43_11 TaxID=1974568 RepID=A0A2M6WL38_9BACT|nr:MAG: preprotein translocase subunit SecE [Candidatus Falkowbacteria bacterium CG10_big_fil_rev_8_21_14_0_10_43_11]
MNFANKISAYIKESIEEIKKVTWPTRKETKNYTLLVIGASLAIAAYLGALDYIFNFILELIL